MRAFAVHFPAGDDRVAVLQLDHLDGVIIIPLSSIQKTPLALNIISIGGVQICRSMIRFHNLKKDLLELDT